MIRRWVSSLVDRIAGRIGGRLDAGTVDDRQARP